MKLAIAIMSYGRPKERRDAIRATWGIRLGNVAPTDVDCRFFVGDIDCDDAERLNCPDDYGSCWLKQLRMLEALQDYDHVFFCDDDTYVVVERLLNCGFESFDYMGYPCLSEEGVPLAQGGAGFWMSPKARAKALEIAASKPEFPPSAFHYSDRYVGFLMKEAGIALKEDFRFNMGKYSCNKGFCNLSPNRLNPYITAHYVTPENQQRLYDHFYKGGEALINLYTMNFFGRPVVFSEKEGKWHFSFDGRHYVGPFEMAHLAEHVAFQRCKG